MNRFLAFLDTCKLGLVFLKFIYLAEQSSEDKQTVINIIDEIRAIGPLTGKGFFEISRRNLTGMLGLSFTYLIILLQFGQY